MNIMQPLFDVGNSLKPRFLFLIFGLVVFLALTPFFTSTDGLIVRLRRVLAFIVTGTAGLFFLVFAIKVSYLYIVNGGYAFGSLFGSFVILFFLFVIFIACAMMMVGSFKLPFIVLSLIIVPMLAILFSAFVVVLKMLVLE